jgi:hypothetical protein
MYWDICWDNHGITKHVMGKKLISKDPFEKRSVSNKYVDQNRGEDHFRR